MLFKIQKLLSQRIYKHISSEHWKPCA